MARMESASLIININNPGPGPPPSCQRRHKISLAHWRMRSRPSEFTPALPAGAPLLGLPCSVLVLLQRGRLSGGGATPAQLATPAGAGPEAASLPAPRPAQPGPPRFLSLSSAALKKPVASGCVLGGAVGGPGPQRGQHACFDRRVGWADWILSPAATFPSHLCWHTGLGPHL